MRLPNAALAPPHTHTKGMASALTEMGSDENDFCIKMGSDENDFCIKMGSDESRSSSCFINHEGKSHKVVSTSSF